MNKEEKLRGSSGQNDTPPCAEPDQRAALPTAVEEVEAMVRRPVWKRAKVMLPLWVAILSLLLVGLHSGVDAKLLAGGLVLVGLLSNAFGWLVALVSMVPLVGPLVVKVLAIPFIWLLNAIGYLVSIVAIRRGYSKDVLTYRGLTVALLAGIAIGFILGKLIG